MRLGLDFADYFSRSHAIQKGHDFQFSEMKGEYLRRGQTERSRVDIYLVKGGIIIINIDLASSLVRKIICTALLTLVLY